MRGRPNSVYLCGCEKIDDDKPNAPHIGKVRCPIWQYSGHLYLKTENVQIDNDSAWQLPNIVCDDCETVFVNSLLVKMKMEAEANRLLRPSRIGLTA